jgi:two-component sensor histidine kinase
MAVIHQKLYQSDSVARIPMAAYIEEVASYLHESYDLPQPIKLQVQVAEMELDVTQAVPLGLIINEALTNAFKYAFADGRIGCIAISLQQPEPGHYALVIADDGVGLPAGFEAGRSRSLGMTLLHGFSEQLGGELTLSSPPGLHIQLLFAEEKLSPAYTLTEYAY